MPPRTTPKIAYGDYVAPDRDRRAPLALARLELMGTVRRAYPPMLERLSAEVFPAYADLENSGANFDAILSRPGCSPLSMIPESSLKSALFRWAKEFHAKRDWLLDDALRTLRAWHVASDWRMSLRWNPIGDTGTTVAVGKPFQFDWYGWEMQLLTWPSYRHLLREGFERRLKEYEADCKKLAESCGLVRAPHKYSPSNLDWFVLYQFAGLTSTEIVRRESLQHERIDESTVLKGIKAAAKLLGWGQLRKPKGYSSRKIR